MDDEVQANEGNIRLEDRSSIYFQSQPVYEEWFYIKSGPDVYQRPPHLNQTHSMKTAGVTAVYHMTTEDGMVLHTQA